MSNFIWIIIHRWTLKTTIFVIDCTRLWSLYRYFIIIRYKCTFVAIFYIIWEIIKITRKCRFAMCRTEIDILWNCRRFIRLSICVWKCNRNRHCQCQRSVFSINKLIISNFNQRMMKSSFIVTTKQNMIIFIVTKFNVKIDGKCVTVAGTGGLPPPRPPVQTDK